MKNKLEIAIVHDYLIDFGGAERVLAVLYEMYPKAPIYVSIYRPRLLGKHKDIFKDATVMQSWFGKIPFAEKLISPLRFLLPLIWEGINLKKYDLIISSSSWAVTKGFDKKKGAIEVCYCHTPPRYLYKYDTSRRFTGFFGSLVNIYGTIVNHFMRLYDYKRAQDVDYFIANSKEVARRIEKFYRRNSKVIYPPIEIKQIQEKLSKDNYYLTGGRFVVAKNFELIIKTFNKLKLPLKIYGSGVLENKLKDIAKSNIEFVGKVDDETLSKLYSNAKGFILAQKDEDFGMTSVEAQAYGCPVIAFRGGGYLESVTEGKTGIFFDELDVESLSKAVKKFDRKKFNLVDLNKNAKRFSKERFIKEMTNFVGSLYGTK